MMSMARASLGFGLYLQHSIHFFRSLENQVRECISFLRPAETMLGCCNTETQGTEGTCETASYMTVLGSLSKG